MSISQRSGEARDHDVVVIGGGGLQAQAMFEAAGRGGGVGAWLAADRAWLPERAAALQASGVETTTLDALADPTALRDLTARARLVANFAGPYYRTGGAVLDACIETRTDYLDICDDSDATISLLERDAAAGEAGVRALIGMGSSPGVTNVLVRAAVDALDGADEVSLCWIVDVADVGGAAAQHFFHIFTLVDADGTKHPVPTWEELRRRTVEFPAPIGVRTVVELAHPEPITLPRFLPVGSVRNFGGIVPDDAFGVSWALARLGGGSDDVLAAGAPVGEVARELYARYHETRVATPYVGGGLVVEVRRGEQVLRFSSGDEQSMEESTGTPAAAGIALMLAGRTPASGVFAPECLEPGEFLPALGAVSRNSGSLKLHRIVAGAPVERIRLRDLVASPRRASAGDPRPTARGDGAGR